jgi:hypothetical protein
MTSQVPRRRLDRPREWCRRLRKPTWNEAVGLVLILFALASIAQAAWFSAREHRASAREQRVAACQAAVNRDLIVQLKARTQIGVEDRLALVNLVKAVVNSTSRKQTSDALEAFLLAEDEADRQRGAHPLPEIPTETDCAK